MPTGGRRESPRPTGRQVMACASSTPAPPKSVNSIYRISIDKLHENSYYGRKSQGRTGGRDSGIPPESPMARNSPRDSFSSLDSPSGRRVGDFFGSSPPPVSYTH